MGSEMCIRDRVYSEDGFVPSQPSEYIQRPADLTSLEVHDEVEPPDDLDGVPGS